MSEQLRETYYFITVGIDRSIRKGAPAFGVIYWNYGSQRACS